MKIMDFIASEEGQKLLVEDGLGMMPATINGEIPDDPVFEQIRTQIESGRYIMRPPMICFRLYWKTILGPSSEERWTAKKFWINAVRF